MTAVQTAMDTTFPMEEWKCAEHGSGDDGLDRTAERQDGGVEPGPTPRRGQFGNEPVHSATSVRVDDPLPPGAELLGRGVETEGNGRLHR